MPLLYTVVARKNVVLARHAMIIGNFAEVTELVLSRIDETKNKKMSYSSDSYMYHYVYAENNLTFLCITDDEFKRSSAFAFLDSIETKFNTQYAGRNASTTVPLALNNELAPIFAAEMKKFNLIEDQNKLMPVEEGNFLHFLLLQYLFGIVLDKEATIFHSLLDSTSFRAKEFIEIIKVNVFEFSQKSLIFHARNFFPFVRT